MKSLFALNLFSIVLFINFSYSQANYGKIDVPTFKKEMSKVASNITLDVRTEAEFQSGHLAKAVNINYNSDNFMDVVSKMDKSKNYYVYCAVGGRSARAADLMRANGFQHVFELIGGINAWKASGLPVEK
jgi:rhodanese-related sulfurtransferase